MASFVCAVPTQRAMAQGWEIDLKDLPALSGFKPVAGEFYNQKPEQFWYKGSISYVTRRYFQGFSEVNYTILHFSSPQAMHAWDARFARIGIREGWRGGDVFKNGTLMRSKAVSKSPPPLGLIALHLDFAVENTVILVGGNQHKSQAEDGGMSSTGLADARLKQTVQAVAEELKRQVIARK